MSNLVDILRLDYGEVLLFFNYSAVTRLLGGLFAGTHDNRVLVELFGSVESVDRLVELTSTIPNTEEREFQIRDHFIRCLRVHSSARFYVPFRFESKGSRRTSHYLVHCCDDPLGFKIMKHVMWEVGRSEGDAYGRLTFLQDSERGTQFDLFRTDIEARKSEIMEHVRQAPRRIREFTVNWMNKPSDPFSEKVYKTMLLELERDGQVVVYDKKNEKPQPAEKRPRRNNSSTLGDDYWIRLSEV